MSDDWLKLVSDPEPWAPPRPLPSPVVTQRLVVRLYERGDGPALFRAISADRGSLLPWMVWARTDHQDEGDSIYYVEKSRRATAHRGCRTFPMTIVEHASGEIVGGTGLEDIRPGLRQAEIGYWVRGDRRRQGMCTEAVGGLISAAFRSVGEGGWGLRRVVIECAADNHASAGVCRKLGLRLEGRQQKARYLGPVGAGGPGYVDMLSFAVLAGEWDTKERRGGGASGPGGAG